MCVGEVVLKVCDVGGAKDGALRIPERGATCIEKWRGREGGGKGEGKRRGRGGEEEGKRRGRGGEEEGEGENVGERGRKGDRIK